MPKLPTAIRNVETLVTKYALAALCLLVFVAAVARTVGQPIGWAIDIATFLFAWCVFLGGDIAMREDKLFTVAVLTARLPWRAQAALNVVNYSIIAVFLVAMIGYGCWLAYITRVRPFQGIPGFSYSWVTISVPIGCALMLATAVQKIRAFMRSYREGVPIAGERGPSEAL